MLWIAVLHSLYVVHLYFFKTETNSSVRVADVEEQIVNYLQRKDGMGTAIPGGVTVRTTCTSV